MADTYEKDLAQKSSLTTSDFIRVVGSDNVSYKQLVSDVAKKMIELTAPSGSLLDIALNDSICPTGFVKTLSPRNTTASALPSTECLYGTVYVNKRTATAITVVIICESKSIYINTYTGSWSGWTLMPTRAEVDALNSKTAVSVTAGENVVIDTNKSYKCGNVLFLSVRGHTTANVANKALFSFSGVTANPYAFTFGIPVGTEWGINGIAYGYINSNNVVGTIGNGKYFHLCQAFLCS